MYKLASGGVILDGRFIPADETNRHWQEFLAWLAAGNTPEPADEPTPEQLAREAEIRQAPLTAKEYFKASPAAVDFVRLTPAEQEAWIRAATQDQTRTLIAYLTVAISAGIKREFLQ